MKVTPVLFVLLALFALALAQQKEENFDRSHDELSSVYKLLSELEVKLIRQQQAANDNVASKQAAYNQAVKEQSDAQAKFDSTLSALNAAKLASERAQGALNQAVKDRDSLRATIEAELVLIKKLKEILGGQHAPETTPVGALQSFNYPNYFLRAKSDSLVWITTLENNQDKQEATFKVVPGLANPKCVTFESVAKPGNYLRHQGYAMKLHPSDNTQLFIEDATFCQKPGLADSTWTSLESFNYPGYYIRHQNYQVFIHKDDGSDTPLFKKDTTFRLAQ